jgi:hypothetical protein
MTKTKSRNTLSRESAVRIALWLGMADRQGRLSGTGRWSRSALVDLVHRETGIEATWGQIDSIARMAGIAIDAVSPGRRSARRAVAEAEPMVGVAYATLEGVLSAIEQAEKADAVLAGGKVAATLTDIRSLLQSAWEILRSAMPAAAEEDADAEEAL